MLRFFEVWRSSYDPVWHSPILELFGLTSVIGRITHFVLAEGAWGGGGWGGACVSSNLGPYFSFHSCPQLGQSSFERVKMFGLYGQ